MGTVFLQVANSGLDEADAALERPQSPRDYPSAITSLLLAIETAIEEFTLELSTASETPEFTELVQFARRARSMALEISHASNGQRKLEQSFARSVQQVLNAVHTHVRLLQHTKTQEAARVGSADEILALDTSFSKIESALDRYLASARTLFDSL